MSSRRSHKSRKSVKSRKSSKKTYLPHPTKNALYPYKTSLSASERHRILHRKVKELGYSSLMKDLNLRATLVKNTSKRAHAVFEQDMDYLRAEYR